MLDGASSRHVLKAVRHGAEQAARWVKSRIDDLGRASDDALRLLALAAVLAALFVILMARVFTPSPLQLTPIPYSVFKQNLDKVASITTKGRNIDGEMKQHPGPLIGFHGTVRSFTT